jgi:hypothetical protein
MGGRRPEGHITDPRNARMEQKRRRQRKMEAPFEGGQGSFVAQLNRSWFRDFAERVWWDLRHSQQCCWRFKSSAMLRRIDRQYQFVSNWWCRQETGDNYRLVLLTNYNSVDQTKENVIGTACSTYWGEQKSKGLVGKPAGKRPRSRRIYDDNIKADLQEIWWGHGMALSGSV